MQLDKTYIPFESIFPNLVGYLSDKEDFHHHFPKIDHRTPYGQAHKGTAALERSIKHLHLIMHRIRTGCGVSFLPSESKHETDFQYLPIDVESYFVWLRKTMDQVAYLTPLFYPRKDIVSRSSFNDQYIWFTKKRPEFDKSYTNFLNEKTKWFLKIRDIRDDAMHRYFWSYVDMKNWDDVSLKRMRGNRTEQEVESLSQEIGKYYLKLVAYSKYYEDHFKGVLEKENGKFEFRQLNAQMVSKYASSINYFVEKGNKK